MSYDQKIRETRACDTITAILWCGEMNAKVTFGADSTVTVYVGKDRSSGKTLPEAVITHALKYTVHMSVVGPPGKLPGQLPLPFQR